MCNCKAKIFIDDEFKTYSFNEIRLLKDKWFKKFREINKSDRLSRDPAFERYKEEIEDMLATCKCPRDIFEEPGKDITLNILNARERRAIGQSPWKRKDNKAEGDKATVND